MTTPASPTPLSDAEIERKIRNAESQLAHQDTGFFVPFEEYIPVYRELLERRAECARLEGIVRGLVDNPPLYFDHYGDTVCTVCGEIINQGATVEEHDEQCPYRSAVDYVSPRDVTLEAADAPAR